MATNKGLAASNSICFRGLNPSFHHCYITESRRPDDLSHLIVAIDFIIVILGLIGNICLFFLMRRKRFSSEYFSVYFSYLAVSDSLNLICSLAADILELNKEGLSTIATDNHCVIMFTVISIPVLASSWLIVHLTYDCFLSSCSLYNKFTSSRRRVCLVASFTVFLSIVVTVLFATSYREATSFRDGTQLLCQMKMFPEPLKGELLWLTISNIAPMFLILVLALIIICGIRKSGRFRNPERSRWNHTDVLICYIALMCLVEWLPGNIISAIKTSLDMKGIASSSMDFIMANVWQASLMFFLFSYCQNFYILVLVSPLYRLEFLKMVGCKKDGEDSNDEFDLEPDNAKAPMLKESED